MPAQPAAKNVLVNTMSNNLKHPSINPLHRVQVMDFRSILPLQKRRRTFDDRKHIYTKGAFFGCIAYMQACAKCTYETYIFIFIKTDTATAF